MSIREEMAPVLKMAETFERRAKLLHAFPKMCMVTFTEDGLAATGEMLREAANTAIAGEDLRDRCARVLDHLEKKSFLRAILFLIAYRIEAKRMRQ